METLKSREALAEALARRHQIPCAACSATGTRAVELPWLAPLRVDAALWTQACDVCHGEGRIGNCPDCRGEGVIWEGGAHGCTTCKTKGWIGNCPTCRGLGVLEGESGYRACATCDGYGHIERDLREPGPARHALIITHASGARYVVGCGTASIRFGRLGRPVVPVDFRLVDGSVTKAHFDIDWNASASTHEVNDYGRYSLTLNGKLLAGAQDRAQLYAEGPITPDRARLKPGDVLKIGLYAIEYVKLQS